MQIELWRDKDGFRFLAEDNEFDLTDEAFDRLVLSLESARAMDAEGDYRIIHLDLPEEE